MTSYTATYSPDDNKLRLYASSRLDAETYARVKAHGFKWAPKQELFVAPMWTPEREDLLIELAGEIDDEDKSLVERAEERSERFEGYSENRAKDAESARAAVSAIADNIPLGQPILVGHHSEKRARKDAERIENGMRKAVKMWRQSEYWERRAAGALRHAKYKELPAVRARRIKGLEAEERKQQKYLDRANHMIAMWSDPVGKLKRKDGQPVTLRAAVIFLANVDSGYYASSFTHRSGYVGPLSLWEAAGGNIHDEDPETVAYATAEEVQARAIANHQGYIPRCERWLEHYRNRLAYERAMLAEAGGTIADRTKPEKGGAVKCWASHRGGWSYIVKVNKVTVSVLDNWGNEADKDGSRNFTRNIEFDKLRGVMTPHQVEEARQAGTLVEFQDKTGFFLTDAPVPTPPQPKEEKPEAAAFEAMQETLKAGVQVVSAPQLFPTPTDLAARMVELVGIQPGDRVLEPSAGTGVLLGAMGGQMFEEPGTVPYKERNQLHAVEINTTLCDRLRQNYPLTEVHCQDFLEANGDLGSFDRIVMNPPFENAVDIKHILHAKSMLKPGGRLVALCANGPRQERELYPHCSEWHELEDAFKEQGTGVRVVMLAIEG